MFLLAKKKKLQEKNVLKSAEKSAVYVLVIYIQLINFKVVILNELKIYSL